MDVNRWQTSPPRQEQPLGTEPQHTSKPRPAQTFSLMARLFFCLFLYNTELTQGLVYVSRSHSSLSNIGWSIDKGSNSKVASVHSPMQFSIRAVQGQDLLLVFVCLKQWQCKKKNCTSTAKTCCTSQQQTYGGLNTKSSDSGISLGFQKKANFKFWFKSERCNVYFGAFLTLEMIVCTETRRFSLNLCVSNIPIIVKCQTVTEKHYCSNNTLSIFKLQLFLKILLVIQGKLSSS